MWWLVTCAAFTFLLWRWKWASTKPPGIWQEMGIPFIPSGNVFSMIFNVYFNPKSATVRQQEVHEACGDRGYIGTYIAEVPLLCIKDPGLAHKILVTDFSVFDSRGSVVNEELDPLQGNLFNMGGERWRRLRGRLGPALGAARLRALAPSVETLAPELLSACSSSGEPVEVRKVAATFTTRVIARAAFGIEADHPRYLEVGRLLTRPNRTRASLRLFLRNIAPWLVPALGVKIFPKELDDFFFNLVRQTVKMREKDGADRKDFIKIMMELKEEQPNEHDVLTESSMAANAMLFYAAGFETTAATLAFCLYELAKNPDVQTRLATEVRGAVGGGRVTHETVKDLPYLKMVIDETLRKYPPTLSLLRQCNEDYGLPGGEVLPKGTRVEVPVFAIHHDSESYPLPERFDPERFSPENRSNIPRGAFIPFGDGPRMCLGMTFALMELKIGLSTVLSEYRVSLDPRTPEDLTFLGGTSSFLLSPKETIWLLFHHRP